MATLRVPKSRLMMLKLELLARGLTDERSGIKKMSSFNFVNILRMEVNLALMGLKPFISETY